MKCCGVAAGRSGRNLEILKAKTSLCCTSLWTQLPHQEDHQSSCRDYATLCTDPNSVNMYESKYGALSDSPLVTVQGMISPNEPLVWSVQLQKRLQSQKRGGQFASPFLIPLTPPPSSHPTGHTAKTSGDALRRKQSGSVWCWWILLRSGEAFGGAPLKCPSDRLPHYLTSPECQPTPLVEEGARGRLDQPAPGVPSEGRVVLLLKVRWLYLRPRASGIPTN